MGSIPWLNQEEPSRWSGSVLGNNDPKPKSAFLRTKHELRHFSPECC